MSGKYLFGISQQYAGAGRTEVAGVHCPAFAILASCVHAGWLRGTRRRMCGMPQHRAGRFFEAYERIAGLHEEWDRFFGGTDFAAPNYRENIKALSRYFDPPLDYQSIE